MNAAKAIAIALTSSALIFVPTIAGAKGPRSGKAAKPAKSGQWNSSERMNKTGWRQRAAPPGWSKGKKTGWNGKELPPGLIKRR